MVESGLSVRSTNSGVSSVSSSDELAGGSAWVISMSGIRLGKSEAVFAFDRNDVVLIGGFYVMESV